MSVLETGSLARSRTCRGSWVSGISPRPCLHWDLQLYSPMGALPRPGKTPCTRYTKTPNAEVRND